MELFQWKTPEETMLEKLSQAKEKLADNLNLDVNKIILNKIYMNSKKCPIKQSFGLIK